MIGLFSNYGAPMRIQGSVRKVPHLGFYQYYIFWTQNVKKSVNFLAMAVIIFIVV